MNENINLCEILKDCPVGVYFWSPLAGVVVFGRVYENKINIILSDNTELYINYDGRMEISGISSVPFISEEIMLYPSKEQRDWSKFSAPWYKKERFDPKTLKALDKILLRDEYGRWHCGSFSHINKDGNYKFGCFELKYKYYIPYNNETRYLIGTTDEAPEYYRYWED